MQNPSVIRRVADFLRSCLGRTLSDSLPVGLVLGTGLSQFARHIDGEEVPYESIPDFPKSSTLSHKGSFVVGSFHGLPLIVQAGRCHLYEGYSPQDVCMGVRVMHALGIHTLILTNACGALNPFFRVGSLFMAVDQINMTGCSPLIGPNHDAWGVRFPDMSRPFDPALCLAAEARALALGIALEKGVYIGVHGPELETPAETRFYRMLGADAIGMSSVLEVICANHLGLRVLELSSVANKNLPDCMEPIAIEEIVAASERAEGDLLRLLEALVPDLAKERKTA
ncbi:MAG: purine-nucleoside phosphorylase [Desulfovibrio sp.]|nr:purine-nucleoside phosphorylase [Desulfovibrio sp.]